jgi:ElaB/YqjD/DUF883 family membrane-anchored ribosome-binding protein
MAKKQAMEADAVPADAESGTDKETGTHQETLSPDPLEQLQAAASESYEKLAEAATQLTDQAREVYAASEEYVRQYPGSYVLGAFALGCLLGVLLGRD